MQKHETCRRCGRKLKNPESIELGFGTTCYRKFLAETNIKPLFTVNVSTPAVEPVLQPVKETTQTKKHKKLRRLMREQIADGGMQNETLTKLAVQNH